jgi:hypothetical protein
MRDKGQRARIAATREDGVFRFASVEGMNGPPDPVSGSFLTEVRRDAAAYLAGGMTAHDFAASVWFLAGSEALRRRESERSAWLEQWIRFAHWDDELDGLPRGRGSAEARRRIETALRQEAMALVRP